ncbi:MAG TPA: hypothetical protein VHB97_14545 [Polyangia bacterium]|nr:hypothetical protein [Polyangia bacterium]
MRARTILVALLVVVAFAARAEAKHVRFLGPHPIAAKFGGGYCYIEAPHMHVYAPDRPNLYQQVGDEYVFAGDPTPFGYEGERHPFYGHHPVIVDGAAEPVYCLIDGPHFHDYAAPSTPDYRVKDGVAFYVAPIPPVYVRPARVRVVNAEYRPYVSFRPMIEVAPPPEWHGEVYVGAPGVEVSAPGVFIAPPSPRVIVGGPRVVVGAPAPPGVVVGAPGPVFVGERHEGHWEHREEHWEHHDNGRHEGWGDHGGGEHGHGGGRGHH